MKVSDVMTGQAEFVAPNTSLREAAERMAALDTGFLAISDEQQNKLEGVITDRDIVVRALAKGLDPNTTMVNQVETRGVLYCFADDDLESACKSMYNEQVHRLIVLDNPDQKRLAGVISLGDIVRHDQDKLAETTLKGILSDVAA